MKGVMTKAESMRKLAAENRKKIFDKKVYNGILQNIEKAACKGDFSTRISFINNTSSTELEMFAEALTEEGFEATYSTFTSSLYIYWG